MEVFDLQKLITLIETVSRLAEGKDPILGAPLPEDSELNDPELIRRMFFIREILQAVKRNGGTVGAKAPKRGFPMECLAKFVYEEDKPITRLMAQIKDLAEDPDVKGIPTKTITDWLKNKGYLEEETDRYTGKKTSSVTPEGNAFGLYEEQRMSYYGRAYTVVLYNRSAQEFLVRNLEAIMNGEVIDPVRTPEISVESPPVKGV